MIQALCGILGLFLIGQEGLLPVNIVRWNPVLLDLPYSYTLYIVPHEALMGADLPGGPQVSFRTVLVANSYFESLVFRGFVLRGEYSDYIVNFNRNLYSSDDEMKTILERDIQRIVQCFGDNMLEVAGVSTGLVNCNFKPDKEAKVWQERGRGFEDLQDEPRVVVMG